MSYQVLARKWRPQQFGQLVGQEHVKNALGNALNNNRLHHAYLFTGTRGVGKTTIARIFAKSLNCERGVSASPCGQCSACVEIDAGNFVDLLEIDAASRTKVEDTRDILDNVQYAPSRGRFKVYLIDEVHMLSKHSFNALLKTLEEPPPHVKFLLATTDPQKLPVTVLSRCLQFNLLALSPEQIKQHLAFVLAEESIPFEAEALTLIARAAKGSLRDSLSLTDQAIAQSNANLTLPVVRNMLGYLEQNWSQQLLLALLQRDAQALQQHVTALVAQHSNFTQVLDDMLSLLHLTALTQLNSVAAQVTEQQEFVSQLAADLSPETVQLYYQLLISGKKELPYAPDLLTGLEMALMRAMAFVPARNNELSSPTSIPKASPPVNKTTPVQPVQSSADTPTGQRSSTAAITAENIDEQPVSQLSAQPEALTDSSVNIDILANTGNSPVIDKVTARIMQRRGLSVEAAPLGNAGEKKPERQAAPPVPVLSSKPATSSSHNALPRTKQTESNIPIPAPESDVLSSEVAAIEVELESDTAPPWVTSDDASLDQQEDNDEQPQWDNAADAMWQHYQAEATTAEPFDGNINEQNFSVRFAAQVDSWARRVEQLDTGGLSRLFLLNSAMQLNNGQLLLTVAQSQQHLDTADFRIKLQQVLEQSFGQPLQIEINYQPEVAQCPLAIQQRIEQERKNYVCQLLQNDENVLALQQLFDAELLMDTVQVN